MGKRFEIRLSGSGGQGLIIAGIILAEAAARYDSYYVCQTQSYGPEARGGASKAEVIVSDAEIDYPKVIQPDVLLALNQKAFDAYALDLKPGGSRLVDEDLVHDRHALEAVAIPFTRIAREQLGRTIGANIVALGALAQLTGLVSPEHLEAAVLARVPPGTEELNIKALQAGIATVEKILHKTRG